MDETRGVFISHIGEESATAILLKDLLQRTFSRNLPVFVSSDYESIRGGDTWYTRIVQGIRASAVVIVLLSPDSVERKWINFEAGVGVGANVTVIPALIHGLTVGRVGHPLTSLHIRSLETQKDVNAVMNDVGAKIGCVPKALIDASGFLAVASQATEGTGWLGVEYQPGIFLAVDGPFQKLQKIEDQAFMQGYADALRKAGFIPHMANRYHMGPSVAAGNKKVFVTDKKTYRAEITDYDTILTAKVGA
jgi:hypothetical protein